MKNSSVVEEREERLVSLRGQPHLSHAQIQKYLDCPEKYRLYYIEGLRPRYPSASLVFGQVVHQALAHLFQTGEDPVAAFEKRWNGLCAAPISYKPRESWEKLAETGKTLLEKFVREEMPKIGQVEASEKVFTLDITSLARPFVGVIDLVADLEGKKTVVDFKTAASSYDGHEVALSDQLTAYALAEPGAEQVALCVLVKTREPKIEWHPSTRTAEQLTDYLTKTGHIAREITDGRFYKRPGKWCGWCDYLPVCLGDRSKTQETLIHVP